MRSFSRSRETICKEERPGGAAVFSERSSFVRDIRSADPDALICKVHHLRRIIRNPFQFLSGKRHGIRHEMFAGARVIREFSTEKRQRELAFLRKLTVWFVWRIRMSGRIV